MNSRAGPGRRFCRRDRPGPGVRRVFAHTETLWPGAAARPLWAVAGPRWTTPRSRPGAPPASAPARHPCRPAVSPGPGWRALRPALRQRRRPSTPCPLGRPGPPAQAPGPPSVLSDGSARPGGPALCPADPPAARRRSSRWSRHSIRPQPTRKASRMKTSRKASTAGAAGAQAAERRPERLRGAAGARDGLSAPLARLRSTTGVSVSGRAPSRAGR